MCCGVNFTLSELLCNKLLLFGVWRIGNVTNRLCFLIIVVFAEVRFYTESESHQHLYLFPGGVVFFDLLRVLELSSDFLVVMNRRQREVDGKCRVILTFLQLLVKTRVVVLILVEYSKQSLVRLHV